MKVLVIGDVHGRKFWRQAIADNIDKVDKIIFLGDYLDPYQNEIEENPELMECEYFGDSKNLLKMLEDIVSLKKNEPDKYILLTGNHTDSYIWSKFRAATRTDYKSWEKYHKFFSQNLEYFNLVWIENNTIFSHAGISEGWKNERFNLESSILDLAKNLLSKNIKEFPIVWINALSDISHRRYGDMPYGSCEWADIMEHIDHYQSEVQEKIVPLGDNEIYQVFGHTRLQKPLITDKWACLDCRQGFIFDTITHECKSCL
jgi:hypothetical protein